jgi:hypothetical protein
MWSSPHGRKIFDCNTAHIYNHSVKDGGNDERVAARICHIMKDKDDKLVIDSV